MNQLEKNYYTGKLHETMSKQELWEIKGKKGTCRKCGQYIKNREEFYLVLTTASDTRTEFPKETNFIIHQHEYDALVDEHQSESLAIFTILSQTSPHGRNGTKVDEEIVLAFKEICAKRKFFITGETKRYITFKPGVRDKLNFRFDKRFQTLEYTGRGLNGFFDKLHLTGFIEKIREELFSKQVNVKEDNTVSQATVLTEGTVEVST